MNKIIAIVLFLSISAAFLTSCGSPVKLADKTKYETDIDSLTISALDPIVQKNDILSINFTVSASEEGQRLMEIYNGTNRANSGTSNLASSGYLVSPKGTITLANIGEVEVAGKTKQQIIETLQQKMMKYIKVVPVVTMRIINFRVYVEGEVAQPGAIEVQNELVSLQEALAIAGGTTTYAVLSDVVITRRENGVTKIAHIDLRGDEIYKEKKEFYYLKQGDYIQIKADKEKYIASNNSISRNIAYATTGITLLVTILTLIAR